MAELPPLETMPQGNLSPELVGQLEHSANWARTFGGSDTNIVQRARHNQDITQYAEALQQQRDTEQANLIAKDKHAQDLYFGAQRLKLQEKEAQIRMQHVADLHPLKVQAQEAQIAADLARERASIQAQSVKSKALLQEAADTDAFHATVDEGLNQGIKIGTPAYAELLTKARIAAPSMKSEIFDDIWKSTSRSQVTPEDAIKLAVDKERQIQQVRQEFKQTEPPKAGKPDSYEQFNSDLKAAQIAYKAIDPKGNPIPGGKLPDTLQKTFEERGMRLQRAAEGATADATTASAAKALDQDTAKQLFEEAGRDKEKARALARQRGYQF